MTATVEFMVRFDGRVPGLESHRLSLDAFRGSLAKMLQALRITADSIAGNRSARRTGKVGKQFDLQLVALEDGSVGLRFALVSLLALSHPEEVAKQAEIAAKAADQFITAIKNESHPSAPVAKKSIVRSFLESLPAEVTTQEYEARVGDKVLNQFTIKTGGHINEETLQDWRHTVPRLREFSARILAIRFDLTKGWVQLREPDGTKHKCLAAPELIDLSAVLHKQAVVAQVLVRPGLSRLLTIRAEQDTPNRPTKEERRKHLFTRWKKTLERLAE